MKNQKTTNKTTNKTANKTANKTEQVPAKVSAPANALTIADLTPVERVTLDTLKTAAAMTEQQALAAIAVQREAVAKAVAEATAKKGKASSRVDSSLWSYARSLCNFALEKVKGENQYNTPVLNEYTAEEIKAAVSSFLSKSTFANVDQWPVVLNGVSAANKAEAVKIGTEQVINSLLNNHAVSALAVETIAAVDTPAEQGA